MRRTMRMALNAYRNDMNGYSQENGGRMEYERMEGGDMRRMTYDNMPENRRRRDSRGRFMEYESPSYAHYGREENGAYGDGKHQDRQQWPDSEHHNMPANVIGFKSRKEERQKKKPEGELDYEKAKAWVEKMGEHFSFDKAKAIMQRIGAMECKPIEFWAVINSLYSDYGEVLEKFSMDSPEVYGALTKAWLEDEDAVENKVLEYLECIVKK